MVTTYLHITYTLLTNNVDTRDPIGSKNWAQVRNSAGSLELRNPQSNFSLFILLRCFYLLQVGKFEELSDIVTFKIIHFVQNIEIELKFHRS